MKRCIYHYPNPISDQPGVGSALRPKRMLEAFRAIGYEVEEVTGYSWERGEKIAAVRRNIKNGTVYDFVYSESVNDPTALSDQDHIPRHPFMDFAFLAFCREKHIPVGLFYRDMYWRFPLFRDTTTLPKRMILVPLFQYDLRKYRQVLDLIYLPTLLMRQYVPQSILCRELPPGGAYQPAFMEQKKKRIHSRGELRIFYVGSISGLYDNRKLFQAVYETDNAYLTVCTHKKQWDAMRGSYEMYLCDRIKVIHKSSEEIKEYYEWADVAAYCLNNHAYLDLAMPIKVFEAISYGTPLLATTIHSIAELIEHEDIGWVVPSTVDELKSKIAYLRDHPEEVAAKTKNTVQAAAHHTWESRARQVAKELTNLQKEKKV